MGQRRARVLRYRKFAGVDCQGSGAKALSTGTPMDAETKDRIAQQIAFIVSNTVDPFKEGIRRSTLISANGTTFALADDTVDLYEELQEQLLQKEGWGEKFSEKYLEGALQQLLANILRSGSAALASEYFSQLVAYVDRYSNEQVVYVPVVGIEMQVQALPIGKVVLRKMTDSLLDELVKKTTAALASSSCTAEEKEHLVQSQRQRIRSLKGLICAEFRAVGEPERARERAEEETRRVLDLLRYAILALHPKGYNAAVGAQGEVDFSVRTIPIIPSDARDFDWHSQIIGPLAPFEISPESIEAMRRIGVFEVSRILEKPDVKLTDFERALLRGIHWFANSQTQFGKANELLTLATCLETFMTLPGNDPVGSAIAEGVAILVAAGLEDRKRLKKKIETIYRMRSEVSHGGRKAILERDLVELRGIARKLTMSMIERKDEFPTQQSLLDWIEDQKLR